jgi:hypothetical protein
MMRTQPLEGGEAFRPEDMPVPLHLLHASEERQQRDRMLLVLVAVFLGGLAVSLLQ